MDAPILRFDRYSPPNRQVLPFDTSVWLEITRGRVRQRLRAVRGPAFLIGSASDCDLVLGCDVFPDAYAYLLVHDEKVSIRRVGDGPELLVNGETIEAGDLFDGDQIAFGPFTLRMVIRERPQRVATDLTPLAVGSWLWDGDLAEI
jgi:hypothetical protein